MSTLVAVGYDDPFKAEEVRLKLQKMQTAYLIDLDDAVVAVKNAKGKVKLDQMHNLTAFGAASGGFWGTLIGMLFLAPLLGLAVGAAAGEGVPKGMGGEGMLTLQSIQFVGATLLSEPRPADRLSVPLPLRMLDRNGVRQDVNGAEWPPKEPDGRSPVLFPLSCLGGETIGVDVTLSSRMAGVLEVRTRPDDRNLLGSVLPFAVEFAQPASELHQSNMQLGKMLRDIYTRNPRTFRSTSQRAHRSRISTVASITDGAPPRSDGCPGPRAPLRGGPPCSALAGPRRSTSSAPAPEPSRARHLA